METHQDSLPKLAKNSFADSYSDDRPAGRTIGTRSPSGVQRKGVDKEVAIAIDNGALRFHPLIKPGWGRQGIAYGPYTRQNGLAFAVFILNGHNTSQGTSIGESLPRRLLAWARGSETESIGKRLLHWIRSKQKKGMVRRIYSWACNTPKRFQSPKIDENLVIGWFPHEVPANPLVEGNAFIIHANEPEGGDLWTRVGTNLLEAFKGLQNIQVYYIAILREKGAAYYAASLPNANGLVAYPNMRPIAIDPFNEDATVYAAIYQSTLGQIGFRVNTRVYGTHVETIPELGHWYGTARAADRLTGSGTLASSAAEVGGSWNLHVGSYERTAKGTRSTATGTIAVLNPEAPSGLIHALVEIPATVTPWGMLWRVQDERNYWSLQITSTGCELFFQEAGILNSVASSEQWSVQPNTVNSIQILDEGKTFSLYLNGQLLFNTWFTDTRLQNATGIGINVTDANKELYFRDLEAHPRSIPIPAALDLGAPWMKFGNQIVITDNFGGAAGDIAGKITSTGNKIWQRDIGVGIIELTGNGTAKVKASRTHPNPGRTAYTVAWDTPNFADLQVQITPPGTGRKQKEKCRGGLIFWQDADNYITISTYLDDYYSGASMAFFYYRDGFEELYDAIWSMVGTRVYWDTPYTLRVAFDGLHFTTFINDEPVLYRALTDVYPDASHLSINRVGIVVNWEWGNDTGSLFNNFIAKV